MNSNLFSLTVFAVFTSLTNAQAEDRLMPSNELAQVRMKLHVDGNAILVNLKNNSQLTITSGEIQCQLLDPSKPSNGRASNGQEWCTPGGNVDAYLDQQIRLGRTGQKCAHPNPYGFDFSERLAPGKSKELYFEVPPGRMPPRMCSLQNLRGRPTKFWE